MTDVLLKFFFITKVFGVFGVLNSVVVDVDTFLVNDEVFGVSNNVAVVEEFEVSNNVAVVVDVVDVVVVAVVVVVVVDEDVFLVIVEVKFLAGEFDEVAYLDERLFEVSFGWLLDEFVE